MRHRKSTRKFGRQTSHYKATLRHLVRALILNSGITTTKEKAKEASRLADKLITLGKGKSIANQRRAYAVLQNRGLVSTLFNELAPLFKDRQGGYTRTILTSRRRGDNAQMAILEFVEKPKVEPVQKKGKKEKKKEKLSKLAPKTKKESPKEPKKVVSAKKETPKTQAPPIAEPTKPKEPKKVKEPKESPKTPEPKAPEKQPEEPKKKEGFFKKLFGRKKEDK
ncbi:MAG: 50S ribosomal protein L17 [Candidatus Omnitrophota bacterium]|jgi:large subunit ribosomal protein L17|nr:50S ribosomal protein L17 [Candidatus Omnitrophota bacterium]